MGKILEQTEHPFSTLHTVLTHLNVLQKYNDNLDQETIKIPFPA